jgi:hypothetical protein
MINPKTAIALSIVSISIACSGTPTSPSSQIANVNAAPATSNTQAAANAQQLTGTASTVFVEVSAGVFGFPSGVRDGVPGRLVTLSGDIDGTNFEPGRCVAGVDMTLGFPTSCVLFGEGPGQFTRARPGSTAFTTCECTVGGVGGSGDQVTLRISYPPATPPQYPAGFTKFTFQDGTGALAGLRGHGTLDFAAQTPVTFTYHFVTQ